MANPARATDRFAAALTAALDCAIFNVDLPDLATAIPALGIYFRYR
jgi:hypothetical protein